MSPPSSSLEGSEQQDQQQEHKTSSPPTKTLRSVSSSLTIKEDVDATTSIEHESALRVKRVADSFTINARAKETIASTQLAQFFEILCVKLRHRISELQVTSQQQHTNNSTGADKDIVSQSLTSMFSPSSSSSAGNKTTFAALGMLLLSQQGWLFQQIGIRAAVSFFLAATIKSKIELALARAQRETSMQVVRQFHGSSRHAQHTTSIEDSMNPLQTERAVREVCRALSLRHVDQIVPLTKTSQIVLADVIVTRVIRHLKRGRFGYPEESRSPLVSSLQRFAWTCERVYHGVVSHRDRIPEKKSLTLLERCVRGLTAEGSPEEDDIPLELEPWFSRPGDSKSPRTTWTAHGVLSKTGLKMQGPHVSHEQPQDMYFAHEFSDYKTYGFAYGAEFEAGERGMKILETSDNANGNKRGQQDEGNKGTRRSRL